MTPRQHTAALLALLAGSAVSALAPSAAAQSTEPFPAQFELSSLLPTNGGDGSDGFVLNGIDQLSFSGFSVSLAGDINGDGIDDLVIGAPDKNNFPQPGESYVVFGGAGVGSSGSFELSSLDGTNGFVINPSTANDRSGYSVSSAGDLNGDGVDDLIIGAPKASIGAGEAYVIFGGPGVGAGGSLDLSTLNGSDGFVLNAFVGFQYEFGFSVSSAGDLNDDGFDDVIVGSDAPRSGVVFGAADVGAGGSLELSALNGVNGFLLTRSGIVDLDISSSPGDFNGDGVDDLLIGGSGAAPNGINDAGETYVVFGGAGIGSSGTIDLTTINSPNGFVLNGIDANDNSGRSVSSAGDVNADGANDLIIAAPFADPNGNSSGESYVVFGGAGLGSSGDIELSALNGSDGFVLTGIHDGDRSGTNVTSAGDINGDGIDDLVIAAPYADPNGASSGESYVVFGGAGLGSSGAIELSAIDGSDGFVLNGINAEDYSGQSVSSAGDVNGDGINDLIIGAPQADPNGVSSAGESYVVFGRNVCLPDLNGDGILDNGDIQVFLALFLAADLGADLNGDGILDNGDIQVFLTLFLGGC